MGPAANDGGFEVGSEPRVIGGMTRVPCLADRPLAGDMLGGRSDGTGSGMYDEMAGERR